MYISDIGTMSAVAKDCTGKFLICVKYVTLPFDLRTTSGNENSRPDGVRILPVPNAYADFEPATLAQQYAEGGAACLSVLTDERFFQGHNDGLVAARGACALPVIRKDFLVDTLQVLEARAIGADCVLLIAACLSAAQLNELHACARESAMDVLVEVHNADELARVHQARLKDGWVLGVNNRNLRTFETRLETTLELLADVPDGIAVVTESGIAEQADVRRMMDANVRRFLIGESLMRQPDPGRALAALITPA